MSKRKNGSPGPGASRSNNKKKRECLLHSLCVPNCSRRTRSRQEADPWGFCPISGYLFSSGGLSLLQLPFSLAALWICSYGGRSWTFRCLPTAAPHLSAPSKLGAYSIVFITGPPFSIYIITHGRRKVNSFLKKIIRQSAQIGKQKSLKSLCILRIDFCSQLWYNISGCSDRLRSQRAQTKKRQTYQSAQ